MTLVMFDIDGTLAETFQVDSDCYVQALKDVFDFADVNADWSSYKHTSDSGILQELVERRLDRAVADSERVAFQNRFISLLTEAASTSPLAFRSIVGAERILQKLTGSADYAVSLATGGWKVSATFKLDKAGLKIGHLPAAFGDDSPARDEIMNLSLKRAALHYRRDVFDAVIYVGDGVWDVRAAKKLGFGFIGIGSGETAKRLRSEGAEIIFPDYLDENAFMSALKQLKKRTYSLTSS